MIEIRRATDDDFDGIWAIFSEVVGKGETYAIPPDTDRQGARRIWMESPTATFVALLDGDVVGTYYIKPNHPGPGSHVCNVGYMVKAGARGHGTGRRMCEHSLVEAKALGFEAMQYNLVVTTNEGAVKLWQDLGFEIVGTLPKAFRHPEHGLVDAHVMYRLLGV